MKRMEVTAPFVTEQDVRDVYEEYAIELDDETLAFELRCANCRMPGYPTTFTEAMNTLRKHAQQLRYEWECEMREAAQFADMAYGPND